MSATTIDRSALMHNYAEPPVTFVRGEGAYLFDVDGKRYLDFLCGIAVTSLGHAHPVVADAVAEQAKTLLHVSNLFGNAIGPEVAITIDRLIGGGSERAGGQVFFGNSGAEANECALKLARRWAGPGRFGVVATWDAFHGRTLATLAATGQPEKQTAFLPLPEGFDHVPFDDLDALETACDAERVGAVILEPILGEAGVMVPSSDYLAGVRQLCSDRNILLIMDEIQTGLGRTGRWFGFQHLGIEPDVVTLAKSLGNGMPVGACWARAEVAAAFVPGDHGSTFGGQPLAMSAARATLAVMEAANVPELAQKAGERLATGLAALPHVRAVRGEGLLLAAELTGEFAPAACRAALDAGLIVNAPRPDSLRLAPPLLVTEGEIDEALSVLGDASVVPTGGSREPMTNITNFTDINATNTRHLFDVDSLTPVELQSVLALAEADPADLSPSLSGKGVALLFERPSNRTRNSTEMAVVALGGHPVYIQGAEVGLDVRETAEDVARTLACFHSIVCARVTDHRSLTRMAAALDAGGVAVPVVNLLSDVAHPCQALADLLTLRHEFGGSIENRTVAYIGDANNVWLSLALAGAMVGLTVNVASPQGFGPSDADLERIRRLGGAGVVTEDPAEAVAGVDAVYTDVWTSMGQEEESRARLDAFAGFTVDASLMKRAAPEAIVLHCLPAHRGEEIAAEVVDGPQSRIWPQAANRMHAMRGLLAWLTHAGPGQPGDLEPTGGSR